MLKRRFTFEMLHALYTNILLLGLENKPFLTIIPKRLSEESCLYNWVVLYTGSSPYHYPFASRHISFVVLLIS